MAENARESMDYDVVIVGAGPAGLSAAIRLKQLAQETGQEISVCVLEKGSEVGAHILSGAIVDPISLNELFPDWKERGAPIETEVTDDRFYVMGPSGQFRLPHIMFPPLMSNHGKYICSLGDVCRWLAKQAEELGVEIYPGFAAAEIIYGDDGSVRGVATGDMGVSKSGKRKDGFTPGIDLRGRYTFFAEGARGHLSKQLMAKFKLTEGRDPQKYGIGIKEMWQVAPDKHKKGLALHSLGWPLDDKTGGGSFMYHYGDNLVYIGFVVHLNYKNPFLSPFEEFQRFKTHPFIRDFLTDGKRLSYGARAITEGGYQSIPKLAFPGGALIGCAAGFINLPRIKGSHNAMKSGMLAAESVFKAVKGGRSHDVLADYEPSVNASHIHKDLSRVRNVKPLLTRFGTVFGTLLGGIDMWANTIFGVNPFGTLRHGKADHETLMHAAKAKRIVYPKPDGVITFDRLSSVFISNTNHEEDQPVHLVLKDPSLPIAYNLPEFDEPAQRYCPAQVYEVVRDDNGQNPRFVINAQNCVHCKTCDIKTRSKT